MCITCLRRFNQLAVSHVEQFGTRDDFKILLEIALRQEAASKLTLKQLMLCCGVPESTLKRRLARLVRERMVIKEMTADDRRVHCYTVSDKTLARLRNFIDELRAFKWC